MASNIDIVIPKNQKLEKRDYQQKEVIVLEKASGLTKGQKGQYQERFSPVGTPFLS